MMKTHIYMYIALALLSIAFSHSQAAISSTLTTDLTQQSWECKSELSKYTNGYCEHKQDVPGCYYLSAVAKYRSCGGICNGILHGSITDEGRCQIYCPDYLSIEGDCHLVTVGSTTTTSKVETTTTLVLAVKSKSPSGYYGLFALTSLLLIPLVYWLVYWPRRQQDFQLLKEGEGAGNAQVDGNEAPAANSIPTTTTGKQPTSYSIDEQNTRVAEPEALADEGGCAGCNGSGATLCDTHHSGVRNVDSGPRNDVESDILTPTNNTGNTVGVAGNEMNITSPDAGAAAAGATQQQDMTETDMTDNGNTPSGSGSTGSSTEHLSTINIALTIRTDPPAN